MVDAYNQLHRARFGFGGGEHPIAFNFFRSLRALTQQFSPDIVYFVLEGVPRNNKLALPEYKGNRTASPDNFQRERAQIVDAIKDLPIVIVRHPDFECDDVLYSVARRWHQNDEVVVLSTDSDFIQMHADLPNLTLWHTVNKEKVEPPDYDYALWKSLAGDKTDNVPKLLSVKAAERLVKDEAAFAEKMLDEEFAALQQRNYSVIKFELLNDEQMEALEIHRGVANFDQLRERFRSYAFKSIAEGPAWDKFVKTFEKLTVDLV